MNRRRTRSINRRLKPVDRSHVVTSDMQSDKDIKKEIGRVFAENHRRAQAVVAARREDHD